MGIYPGPSVRTQPRITTDFGVSPSKLGNPSSTSTSLDKVTLDKLGKQGLAQSSRASLHDNTGILQGGNLRVGTTLTTADDGTSMAHTAARGSADTSDEANSRLVVLVVGLEELGGVLLSTTTNLTNHDDTLGLGVLKEDTKAVNEVGTRERVTADTNDEGLSKTGLSRLVDSFVGQSTGTRDDTNATTLVDEARHDTDLALTLKPTHINIYSNPCGA